MQNNTVSFYQVIASAMKDGCLPEDFSLPKNPAGENEIVFADGARDGIMMYHMGIPQLTDEEHERMGNALKAAADRQYEEAEKWIVPLLEKNRALGMIDDLQNWIMANNTILSPKDMYAFAMREVKESGHTELVKLGLSILELFETDSLENLKRIVRTIGLSDEFTLFAVFVMSKWNNADREIFELAKRVHGWGRIHAIERFAAREEEMKAWLLTEGVHNSVMPAYSALTCWEKSEAEQILFRGPSRQEYAGIRDILSALLDEGPVPGISALENREEILLAFLKCAEEMSGSPEDYETVNEIRKTFAENQVIREKCERILSGKKCAEVILESVKLGRDVRLAKELNLDYKPIVYELLEKDIRKYHALCGFLMKDNEYRKKVLALFERAVPLEEMKTLPKDTLGLGEEYWKERAVEFLIQELRAYPLEGIRFVETALQCAPARTRNGGLSVLECWVKDSGVPLKEYLPELWHLLVTVREREISDQVRERMDRLIRGDVTFQEEAIIAQ